MQNQRKTLMDLEKKFWQSMVDRDTDAALKLLNEPALMVSPHGAIKFDHAGYRKMADKASMTVASFELRDMEVIFPDDTTAILTYNVKQEIASEGQDTTTTQEMNDTSTWIQKGTWWQCVMHTETPVQSQAA